MHAPHRITSKSTDQQLLQTNIIENIKGSQAIYIVNTLVTDGISSQKASNVERFLVAKFLQQFF